MQANHNGALYASSVHAERMARGTISGPDPDHLPPHSVEAEQGVLGCILLDPACLKQCQAVFPNSGVFFDLRHRVTYEELNRLDRHDQPLDLITLHQSLRDNAELDDVGGLPYLAGLPDTVPSAANLDYYVQIVLRKFRARQIIDSATRIVADAHTWNGDADTLAMMERRIGSVFEACSLAPSQQALAARLVDLTQQPPPLRPVFLLADVVVCTPANLTTINAHAKAGKTAVIGAMMAAPMAPDGMRRDTLGFKSSNVAGLAVLHVDSEQSPDDHWHQLSRAVRRAGLAEPPGWLKSYSLTGLSAPDARRAVWAAADVHAKDGKLHSILIDGVADLVRDVNDAGECNAFVADLHALAIERDCPIVAVIHFNPGTEKTRGHLGSQMERKSETNLKLEHDGESTVIFSEKQRRAPILKETGPRFRWNEEAGMHVACDSVRSEKLDEKISSLRCQLDDAFGSRPAMHYNDLVSAVKNGLTVSLRTAERRINECRQLGLVEKSVANLWVRKD